MILAKITALHPGWITMGVSLMRLLEYKNILETFVLLKLNSKNQRTIKIGLHSHEVKMLSVKGEGLSIELVHCLPLVGGDLHETEHHRCTSHSTHVLRTATYPIWKVSETFPHFDPFYNTGKYS